ncbi:P-loop containing nucleoside triphosphate hydrolase protein [Aspergillus uvarum CBS 121591]|uniref:P-loop containing nucleoside triphosphate hydrolase protein n=1 Tax=Aspergillus uvarum CBS 121591 TaxID=1448315 RepID=A0A319CNY2_9EURO|nr:P-loop containing nucleoside triphosphate hydrolase protein [Aspergillus uvarum CBS 121591]PYH86149.1 P-loop containing nucleoside triphosphate hydrolase protein [Aspergillus uvarum CBS 121591]
MSQQRCPFALDDLWGPTVHPCRRAFDFTLLFEQSVLSILPSSLFLLLALGRGYQLWQRHYLVSGWALLGSKLTASTISACLQLALLVIYCVVPADRTRVSIAATALNLVAAMGLALLSYAEHRKTTRPSFLINGYLLLTLLLDGVQVRSLWLANVRTSIASIFTATFVMRGVQTVVESATKTRWLMQEHNAPSSPEDFAGIVSKTFFLWINNLIRLGYMRELAFKDLYPMPAGFCTVNLEKDLWDVWGRAVKTGKNALLVSTIQALKMRLLSPILPRLCLIALTLTQPLLLVQMVNYIHAPSTPPERNIGYGLLGAYAIVYVGIAMTTAWYWHQTYQFITCVRGALVAIVYRKTLSLDVSSTNRSSALTIMNADVERIVGGLRMVHEIWANFIQVAFGAWLLERQVGVAVVPSLVIASVCALLTMRFGASAGRQQEAWMGVVEKRVGMTTSTLSAMKSLRMSGLMRKVMGILQQTRENELKAATGFRWPLSMLFQSAPELASMVACFQRIQQFLLTDPRSDQRKVVASTLDKLKPTNVKVEEKSSVTTAATISIRSASFSWPGGASPVLCNISLSIPRQKLTMIFGPVGCGKTSLLHALLGEIPASEGEIIVSTGTTAYCAQTPWVRDGTLRDNIVAFSDYDERWYKAVLHACALEEDLLHLEDGNDTQLGDNGANLSGGQKQRVSLARAIYARRSVYILDDVLSGLDATTEAKVLQRLLGPNGLLRNNGSTTVLATHAEHHAPYADHIIRLSANGEVVEQGSLSELKRRPSSSTSDTSHAPTPIPEIEMDAELPSTQASSPTVEKPQVAVSEIGSSSAATESANRVNVMVYYMLSIGKLFSLAYVLIAIVYAFLFCFPYVWAEWWSEANERHPGYHQAMYMGIYALFQCSCLIALAVLGWHAVINVVSSAGRSLHWTLVQTTFRAPMSFFQATKLGSIVSRFSQDIQLVDTELPMALLNIFCSGLIMLGQILLIMTSSYWVAISYPVIFLVMFVLQKVYLRTSRQLRKMDLENKGPLYSQFMESLDGLATVRAFGWQEGLIRQNHKHLAQSQTPFYLLFCVQRWLALVMDCLAAGFVLLLIGLLIGLKDRISPGFAGVALSNVISLSGILTDIIMVWTEFETSLTSIGRVRDYASETPVEELSTATTTPPENWPDRGHIEFQNLTATYQTGTVPALRKISLRIEPGEKVGVCGRTGSGKSSLMMALFKMIEVTEGSIIIDDIATSTLPADIVRTAMNAIPQEPCFLPGSVRDNIDPHRVSDDVSVSQALAAVHLENIIEQQGGLDTDMSQVHLSHGQKQLFCLGRAILKRCRIVVLDEATSDIDVATERLIQKVIRERFKECTVITIAHRLDAIMDSNRVVLLDHGEVVEFDPPADLLGRKSRFRVFYEAGNYE